VSGRAIVVGVDGSGWSDAAADRAIELARAFGDRLVIAHAAEPPHRVIGDELDEHRKALEELGAAATGPAVERARAAGVEAEAALLPQRPVPGLLDLATEHDARYIVVGTASERPLTGLILGSVPHKLLHRSSIPILVVPVPEEP